MRSVHMLMGLALAMLACNGKFTGGSGATLTVDIKGNGSDGPITVTGSAYTVVWTSTGAISCQESSPSTVGLNKSGTVANINVGDPYYPPVGGKIIWRISCTDGSLTAQDTLAVLR